MTTTSPLALTTTHFTSTDRSTAGRTTSDFTTPNRATTGRPPALTPLRLARHLAETPGLLSALPVAGPGRVWLKLPTAAGWDAWLIGWPPGARTGWHDHQGSAGAFVVVAGNLVEASVAPADARSRTGGPAAVHAERGDLRRRSFGVGAARQFPDHHIHDMSNDSSRAAYSVHAYSPALTAMASYDWVDGRLTTTGLETNDDW